MGNKQVMGNKQAKEIINKTFSLIESAVSNTIIDDIVNHKDVAIPEKYHMKTKHYPQIGFNIIDSEVLQLKANKSVTEDNYFDEKLAKSLNDPVAKLLYALAWKNGDLNKVNHIIHGIVSKDENEDKGLVFFHFGKFLANPSKSPIIDQHILRAYAIFREDAGNEETIGKLRSSEVIDKSDKELINSYKSFITNELPKTNKNLETNYPYHIDKILFAVGKYVKLKQTKN